MTEELRKTLVIDCYENHWSKVKDIATFYKFIGNCSFCVDAKARCEADGKKVSIHPPNFCEYCMGAKDICDGLSDNTVIRHLQDLAREGKEAELLETIRKGLADYHDKWVK